MRARVGPSSQGIKKTRRSKAIKIAQAPPPGVRAFKTEAALAGGASIEEAQRALAAEIAPIDDIRSTAEYRRRVAANLLAAMWTSV